MDDISGTPTAKKSKNGKVAFTPEIEAECVAACSAGFTIEKCAGLIGVPIGTLKTWTHRFPSFATKMETARKKHELSLLRDIELAGQKSWQAKAWLAERVYSHAIPSARLQVSGSVDHNAGAGFAQLLAGLASRRAEKKAQVIDAQEVRAIEDSKKSQSMLNQLTKHNTSYATLATNPSIDKLLNDNNKQNHQKLSDVTSRKLRNKPMRRRKPRSESLAKYPPDTTTPPATPPATV
jgi:hypothetical protein